MPRAPVPTWFFALAVVRNRDRFLLVHERKHGQLWYLPAGRAEPGETLAEAAVRETLEEAGVAVRVVGVIRIEHSPQADGARVRGIFVAEPVGDPTPKQAADAESLGAEWVRLDQLHDYPQRGSEVRELFEYVAAGGPIYPVAIIDREGAPLPRPSAVDANLGATGIDTGS